MTAKLSAQTSSPLNKGGTGCLPASVFRVFRFHTGWQAASGSRWAYMLAIAGVVLLSGCGPDLPKTVPVSGTIVYRGKPVEGAEVTFMREGVQPGSGKTDAQGHFELTTYYSPDYDALDGVIPGDCAVKVTKTEFLAKEGESFGDFIARTRGRVPKALVPICYANPKTTTLKAAVSEDGANHFDFVLVD